MTKFQQQLTTQTLQTAGKLVLATTAAGAALLVEYKGVQAALNALRPPEVKKLAAEQKEAVQTLQIRQAEELQEFNKQLEASLKTLGGMREEKGLVDGALEKFTKQHGATQKLQQEKEALDQKVTQITQDIEAEEEKSRVLTELREAINGLETRLQEATLAVQTEEEKAGAIKELGLEKQRLEEQVRAIEERIQETGQVGNIQELTQEKTELDGQAAKKQRFIDEQKAAEEENRADDLRNHVGANGNVEALREQKVEFERQAGEKQQAIEIEEAKEKVIQGLTEQKNQLDDQVRSIEQKIGQADQPDNLDGKKQAVTNAQQALYAKQQEIAGKDKPGDIEQLKAQKLNLENQAQEKEKLIQKYQGLEQDQQTKNAAFEVKNQEIEELRQQEEWLKQSHQEAMDKLTGKVQVDLKQKGREIGPDSKNSGDENNAGPGKGDPSDNSMIPGIITGLTALFGTGYVAHKHKDDIVEAMGGLVKKTDDASKAGGLE